MHSARLLVAIALCLTATLAQAAGFRFIDALAAADGPPLKGVMWYPCWLPQQIEYARFQLGGIVVPVAVLPSLRRLVHIRFRRTTPVSQRAPR